MDTFSPKQARQRTTKDARRRVPRQQRSTRPRGGTFRPMSKRFTRALERHFAMKSEPLLAWRRRLGAEQLERQLTALRKAGKAA